MNDQGITIIAEIGSVTVPSAMRSRPLRPLLLAVRMWSSSRPILPKPKPWPMRPCPRTSRASHGWNTFVARPSACRSRDSAALRRARCAFSLLAVLAGSVELLEEVGVELYKISSGEVNVCRC